MTKEEIINFCEMKSQLEPENEDIFNYIIKALEQEPCEDWYDIPSNEMNLEQARQAVRDLRRLATDYHILPKLQPSEDAIHRDRTVQDFVDKCRKCGREKVLDKIRAEIELQRKKVANKYTEDYELQAFSDGLNDGLKDARDILDKYKAERR